MSKGLAIIGIGEVPTKTMPQRTRWDIIYDTVMEAVRDSGLNKNDIEGVAMCAPQCQPLLQTELSFGKLPEELGLKGCKDSVIVNAGGASTSDAFRMAEHWLNNGTCKAVIVEHCTVQSDIPPAELIGFFGKAGVDLQWEYPLGVTYNLIMGNMANWYMHKTGTTPLEMAAVTTALRSWATKDPNSIFYGKPVPTPEQVLESDVLATPLHKRESNVLGDGGCAMVCVSHETAKAMGKPAAYKLSESTRFFSASFTERDFGGVYEGWASGAQEAIAKAGLTIKDIGLFNIYVAYACGHPMMAEALGLAAPGQAGKMFLDGKFSFGGEIGWSTIGEAPGRGHTGSGVSAACYCETARQLMGKAGERQIKDLKYAFQNAGGGSGFNNICSIWGREI